MPECFRWRGVTALWSHRRHGLKLDVDVVSFQQHVKVVAHARLDARQDLGDVCGGQITCTNVDGRARIEQPSLVAKIP
jgi:hypothetical protein